MTLVICPGCRQPVSDRAAVCPHCACPIEPAPVEPLLLSRLRRRYRASMLLSLLATGAGFALSLLNVEYLALAALGFIGFGVSRACLKNLER